MNPFLEKSTACPEDLIVDWKTLATKPYEKETVDPYTRPPVQPPLRQQRSAPGDRHAAPH